MANGSTLVGKLAAEVTYVHAKVDIELEYDSKNINLTEDIVTISEIFSPAFEKSLTETIILPEIIIVPTLELSGDSISISDIPALQIDISIAEAMFVSDALTASSRGSLNTGTLNSRKILGGDVTISSVDIVVFRDEIINANSALTISDNITTIKLTKSLEDLISIPDTLETGSQVLPDDDVTISDNIITIKLAKSLVDSIDTPDTPIVGLHGDKVIDTDSALTISDDITTIKLTKSLKDLISTPDTPETELQRNGSIDDDVAISDGIPVIELTKSLEDLISIPDTLETGVQRSISIDETMPVSDTLTEYARGSLNTGTLNSRRILGGDTAIDYVDVDIVIFRDRVIAKDSALTISDNITAIKLTKSLADSIDTPDTLIAGLQRNVSIDDDVTISDDITAIKLTKSLVDSINILDTLEIGSQRNVSIANDIVTISDSIPVIKLTKSLVDSINIPDTLEVGLPRDVSVTNDIVTISDGIPVIELTKSLVDFVNIPDTLETGLQKNKVVDDDVVTILDNITTIKLTKSLVDFVSIPDTPIVGLQKDKVINEAMSVSDTLTEYDRGMLNTGTLNSRRILGGDTAIDYVDVDIVIS